MPKGTRNQNPSSGVQGALAYGLGRATDAGSCFKKAVKSVGRDCGLPRGHADGCGAGDGDGDGDGKKGKVRSTEK